MILRLTVIKAKTRPGIEARSYIAHRLARVPKFDLLICYDNVHDIIDYKIGTTDCFS